MLNYLKGDGWYLIDDYLTSLDTDDRLQVYLSFKLNDAYSKLPFYLTIHVDWRGRLYVQSFYITYQGSDINSSLLIFHEGTKLNETGLYYFYILGANCHNEGKISKQSFEKRVSWVKSNYNSIINLDKQLIRNAESPFIFAAFCLEIKNLHNNHEYKVRLPIFLDATCSGIQHIAAIIEDNMTGSHVNLIPQNIEDKIGDIYSELLGPINNAINIYGENENNLILKDIKLERKHVKTPIITKTYNVTIRGISEQLKNSFELIDKKNLLKTIYL